MDLLNIAGIGPDNWSERRKTWSFIALAIQKEDCTSIYLGRHTPEEYAEFYECLTARAFNPFAKRLAVELDNRPGERMAVKPENLDMVQDSE